MLEKLARCSCTFLHHLGIRWVRMLWPDYRWKLVLIKPGSIRITFIPNGSSSYEIDSVRPSTANFVFNNPLHFLATFAIWTLRLSLSMNEFRVEYQGANILVIWSNTIERGANVAYHLIYILVIRAKSLSLQCSISGKVFVYMSSYSLTNLTLLYSTDELSDHYEARNMCIESKTSLRFNSSISVFIWFQICNGSHTILKFTYDL